MYDTIREGTECSIYHSSVLILRVYIEQQEILCLACGGEASHNLAAVFLRDKW
jgi:hypothetical protein